jgi:3D (Asp-Asp-Asp) domain-containing protein
MKRCLIQALLVCAAIVAFAACSSLRRPHTEPEKPSLAREFEVEATAYNSLAEQTHGDPNDTAFGKRLQPGMRVIAVSDDLYAQGLREGVRVRIDGLPGEWEVGDRMASRWRKRIDIYMGEDEAAALAWGTRRVTVRLR